MVRSDRCRYVRVSTEVQRTDSQEQELQRHCRQRVWKSLTFYTERISGAKAPRSELDRLVQHIRTGKIGRLIVHEIDRPTEAEAEGAMALRRPSRREPCPAPVASEGKQSIDYP